MRYWFTPQKRTSFLFVILFLFICPYGFSQEESSYGKIKVVFPEGTGEQVIIKRVRNDFLGMSYDTLTIDENMEAFISLEMIRPQMLKVTSDLLRYWRDVYLVPGKEVIINIGSKDANITFEGDLTTENNYLISSYKDPRIKEAYWSVSEEPSRSKLRAKLDRYFNIKREILNEYFPDKASRKSDFYTIRVTEQDAFKHYANLNYYDLYFSDREPLRYDQFIIDDIDLNFLKYGNDPIRMEAPYLRRLFEDYLTHYFILQEYGSNWREVKKKLG